MLDAVEPFLREVVDYLYVTTEWQGQNRGAGPGSPPRLLREAASRISTALAMAASADLQILRAHYDPPPDRDARVGKARGSRNAPPTPPGPQPNSGRPRH